MHLHGHVMTVLAVDGHRPRGSPLHLDTVLLAPHQTVDLAFPADNPGIWMLHCHVLLHAAMGMSMTIDYAGVTTPFAMGAGRGTCPNERRTGHTVGRGSRSRRRRAGHTAAWWRPGRGRRRRGRGRRRDGVRQILEAPPLAPGLTVGVVFAVLAGVALLWRRFPVPCAAAVVVFCVLYHRLGYPGLAPAVVLFATLYAVTSRRERWAVDRWSRPLSSSASAWCRSLPPHPAGFGWSNVGSAPSAWSRSSRSARRPGRDGWPSRTAARGPPRRRAGDAAADASEDRVDVARDVHDVLAHTITVIAVQAAAATEALDDRPEEARAALTAVRGAAREALTELRATVSLLRGEPPRPGGRARAAAAPAGAGRARGPGGDADRHRRAPGARRCRADGLPDRAGGADQHDPARGRVDRGRDRRPGPTPSPWRSPTTAAQPKGGSRAGGGKGWSACASGHWRWAVPSKRAPRPGRASGSPPACPRPRRDRRRTAAVRACGARRAGRRPGRSSGPGSARCCPTRQASRSSARLATGGPRSSWPAGPPRRPPDGHPHARTRRDRRHPADLRRSRAGRRAGRRAHHVRARRVRLRRRCAPGPAVSCSRTSTRTSCGPPCASSPPGEALLAPAVTRTLIAAFAGGPAALPRRPWSCSPRSPTASARSPPWPPTGLSNDGIAARLVISPATAKTHVVRAMSKVGARDRAQLVVLAYQTGLVAPPRP